MNSNTFVVYQTQSALTKKAITLIRLTNYETLTIKIEK